MKKILLFGFLLMSSLAFAQKPGIDKLVVALKQANSTQVANFFDQTIDLKFPNLEESKGIVKATAAKSLSDYFSVAEVKGFDKVSERELGTTMYLAGKLLTKSDSKNITIMLKLKEGNWSIITLRIND